MSGDKVRRASALTLLLGSAEDRATLRCPSKKKTGSSEAERRGKEVGGVPNPLSAAPEQVCAGGSGGRKRRGWNTNTSQEVKSV